MSSDRVQQWLQLTFTNPGYRILNLSPTASATKYAADGFWMHAKDMFGAEEHVRKMVTQYYPNGEEVALVFPNGSRIVFSSLQVIHDRFRGLEPEYHEIQGDLTLVPDAILARKRPYSRLSIDPKQWTDGTQKRAAASTRVPPPYSGFLTGSRKLTNDDGEPGEWVKIPGLHPKDENALRFLTIGELLRLEERVKKAKTKLAERLI